MFKKDDEAIKASFTVLNDKGLHTRPSTELVKCAATFNAQILLHYKKYVVNGKSLLGILMLAAQKGAKIHVEARGADAAVAVERLLELAKNKFNIHY